MSKIMRQLEAEARASREAAAQRNSEAARPYGNSIEFTHEPAGDVIKRVGDAMNFWMRNKVCQHGLKHEQSCYACGREIVWVRGEPMDVGAGNPFPR